MIFYSYNYKFQFTIILLILLKLIKLEDYTIYEFNQIDQIIFFNEDILYIQNNSIIYCNALEKTNYIIETFDSIEEYINIIKINETNFVIFGLDNNYYFNYINYQFLNKAITLKQQKKYNELNFTGIKQLTGRSISENIIIISTIINNNFKIYRINLNNNIFKEHIINEDLIQEKNNKLDIQCDSFDGNIFLCIYRFKFNVSPYKYKFLYYKGEFDVLNTEINGAINEDNCDSGNIIKFNYINNKFLVCYKAYNDDIVSIICQYYLYLNNKIIIENSNIITQLQNKQSGLIIYIYNYSIFIIYNYYVEHYYHTFRDNIYSYLIICSFDFHIKIQSYSYSDKIIYFFINNDNYYYYITEYFFYNNYPMKYITTIIKKELLKCLNIKSITLSNNESKEIDFNNGNKYEYITFSLDTNILLYKDNQIISNNDNTLISLKENSKFILKQREKPDIFENYYCYKNSSFSLICPLNITVCYSSCKTCISSNNVSLTEHFCTSCINGFYPIESEKSNKESFNCYSIYDEKIANYYLYNNAFYPCHNSCKSCSNFYSCLSCKDNYYFKSDINNNINNNDICYTSLFE